MQPYNLYNILKYLTPKLKPFEKEKASKVDEIVDVKAASIWERKSNQRWLNCRDVNAVGIWERKYIQSWIGTLAFEKENLSKVDEIADVKAAGIWERF